MAKFNFSRLKLTRPVEEAGIIFSPYIMSVEISGSVSKSVDTQQRYSITSKTLKAGKYYKHITF
jgi:hypothetical protein